jgi:hypothetical protein
MPPTDQKQRTARKTRAAWPKAEAKPAPAPPSTAKQRIEARFDPRPESRRPVGEEGDAGFDAAYERERRRAHAEADLDAAPEDEASYRAGLEPPRRH